MIRAKLLCADGTAIDGTQELVARWRETADSVLWLDIEGEVDEAVRALLGDMGCDELSIKDSTRLRHPPKAEVFSDNTFILFRGISSFDDELELVPQQVGLWLGEHSLISLHRGRSVSIDHFWQDEPYTALAHPGSLALRLLHFASGRYLDQVLDFEGTLGELEDELLSEQSDAIMRELVAYRSRLRKLRRIFSYHQRMAEQLLQEGSPHLGRGQDDTLHQRRDLYDRCERLHSLCSMYYEICGDLVEGYISLSSHRLNNTMKVLTIITAIFVPLGFLAGLYGMNFEHMPELGWRYSYPLLLLVMASVATGMLLLFRRIRWL